MFVIKLNILFKLLNSFGWIEFNAHRNGVEMIAKEIKSHFLLFVLSEKKIEGGKVEIIEDRNYTLFIINKRIKFILPCCL